MDRKCLKLQVFKNIVLELSKLSHDPKYQVACIIITNDFREICSIGYNGNYKGGEHERDSMETGKSGFLHGEENALISLSKPFELRNNLILICSHKPCTMCAKRIVNAGIQTVYYINDYDEKDGKTIQIFENSKITFEKI
jgi:deoxycytidylate deaminase